jgi:UDP-2,3-diacylglucosamine pyrophosphatase LpxH
MSAPRIDTREKRELIDRTIAENPKAANRTLGRLLYAKAPLLFESVDRARNAVRHRRGVFGGKSPRLKRFAWEKGVAGGPVALPPSLAQPESIYALSPGIIAILCDIHVPFHDEAALNAALDRLDEIKPDTILLGGDAMDFFAVSRWDKDPNSRDFRGELKAMDQFFAHMRKRFQKAKLVWKLGNHEERWRNYLWNKAPEICNLPFVTLEHITNCEKHRVTIVGDRRKVKIGKLTFVHGHELPTGSPVNPARGLYMRTSESYACGHLHRSSEHTEPTANHRFVSCWSIGTLSGLTPEYAPINRYNHGMAEVELRGGGAFSFRNVRIHQGRIL